MYDEEVVYGVEVELVGDATPLEFKLNANVVDSEVTTVQDREVLAMRAFYGESGTLTIVDELAFEDESRVVVGPEDTEEVAKWLRNPLVWLAFKPCVVEVDGRVAVKLS